MKYKKLGKTNLDVSVVGLGTWAIGGDYFGKVQDNQSIEAIQKALDCGVNLIDTAPVYGSGHAEEIIGKAIRGRRDEVIITTKCGSVRKDGKYYRDLRPESIRKEVDASLIRLGVDVIDIYLLHWPDVNTSIEETVEELLKLKKAGKFKHFGVSNFDIPMIKQIEKILEIECVQPQYSILSRDKEEIIAYCYEKNIGVMTYGSLAGGMLSGKFKEKPKFAEGDTRSNLYPFFKEELWGKSAEMVDELIKIAAAHNKPVSHVAINWVNRKKEIATALVGSKTPDQMKENAAAAAWELTVDEIAQIDEAYERLFHG